jgi:signal transduction histidine kinase
MNYVYDQWHFAQWDNAQGIYFRKRVGDYEILVAVPIKYNYLVTSSLLHNQFIAPFYGDERWRLTYRQMDGSGVPIYSYDGLYLFSILEENSEVSNPQTEVMNNFSYQAIWAADQQKQTSAKAKLRMYYIITGVLIGVLLFVAIFSLVKYRGFRRMKMGGKFQMVLTPLVLVILLSIFMLSTEYIRRLFIETQQLRLTKKAHYVQMALQNMYFWNLTLSPANTAALNIDLREMSFVYETDIHVYDMNGRLVGSSTPQLFDLGLLSRNVASEPFFSGNATMVQYEQIGNVRYLSAYTEFINGNYAKIGYVALPSFISQSEMTAHLENFMAKLLPLYIILLLVSILIVWGISHMITSSLGVVRSQIKKYRPGESVKHINYEFSDEVGEIVTQYNQMMDALAESTQRLARTEREMAWRTMARQVAHEINNPLTPMKLTLQQLQRTKGTERFEEYFDRSTQLIIDQIDNLSHIAKSFSSFAKMPEVNPTEVDVAAKLYSFITMMRNNPSDIPIRYVGPESGVMVIADAEQITQVFTNIVRNAMQAMEGRENSDIIIIMKNASKASILEHDLDFQKKWMKISFSDNGPGIPADMIDKVFVPNFTTKNTGAGLGLPISKNIVEGSGGKICFQTSEKGTTFFVYLQKK